MKAKFVYESIRFERGKDPRSIMGIGDGPARYRAEMKPWVEKVFEMAKKAGFKDDREEHLKDWEYPMDRTEEDGEIEYLIGAWVKKIGWPKPRIARVHLVRRDLTPYWYEDGNLDSHHNEDAKEFGSYYVMLSDPTHPIDKPGAGRANLESDHRLEKWATIRPWRELGKNKKRVYENISFERGKDPKTSMEIGSIKFIENVLDEWAEKNGFFPKDEGGRVLGYVEWAKNHPYKTITLGWQNDYPMLELVVYNLKKIVLNGNDKILDFITSDKLDKWMNSEVYENISFERGNDPKNIMGIGLLGVVREELKKLGLTKEASITLQNSYSNNIGTQYQWHNETWSNHAELDIFTNGFDPELRVYNSEDQYEDISGKEEIMEYAMKGELAKFINLE